MEHPKPTGAGEDCTSVVAPCLPLATLTDDQLLTAIDAFLERSGLAPTRFGIEAMREGGLVESLRRGRSLSLKNVNKVLAFIAEWDAANGAPVASEPSATNEAENIGGDSAPFPVASGEGPTPPSSGATSPICSTTSEHPLLPLDSPDCSTSGTAEAA